LKFSHKYAPIKARNGLFFRFMGQAMTDSHPDKIPPCFDCAHQPTERLVEMFVGIAQQKRINLGQMPAERPVFRKLHGVAHGQLRMLPNIPADLKVGVFGHDSLTAWVRFSSDTSPTSPDLQSTTGIGIKVFGVPGAKAFGDGGDTADFIMQNFPVFFVDDPRRLSELSGPASQDRQAARRDAEDRRQRTHRDLLGDPAVRRRRQTGRQISPRPRDGAGKRRQ
jgi:hypothetical protein